MSRPGDAPGPRTPPRVAVCVITHRRPEGLARLLAALDAQVLPAPEPEVRIVVVDNDAEESARSVCRQAASWLGFPLTYATEKRRGIPQARNAALALALGTSDRVAFVDDDCEPAADWLAELLRADERYGADAVTGPCVPRFEAEPPAWARESGIFEHPRYADGAELQVAYTNNVLVRTRALSGLGTLFDERLALTGGEDVELFRRFVDGGSRIVWADAAVVSESVPASRTTLRWVLRRALRVGTSSAFVDRSRAGGWSVAAQLLLHGGWCMGKGALLLLTAPLRGSGVAVHALRLVAFGAGRIGGIFGLLAREYAVTDGR